jgi:hypothetical protein
MPDFIPHTVLWLYLLYPSGFFESVLEEEEKKRTGRGFSIIMTTMAFLGVRQDMDTYYG